MKHFTKVNDIIIVMVGLTGFRADVEVVDRITDNRCTVETNIPSRKCARNTSDNIPSRPNAHDPLTAGSGAGAGAGAKGSEALGGSGALPAPKTS